MFVNKDDLDLTPPEEIRARRIKRFVFLGVLAVCALGIALYFAASPLGGAIKAWQSRRLASQAFVLIEQGKWSEANAKARDAYLLRPTEPESWRAIARLASGTNQWVPALDWWKKVDDAGLLTLEDRRNYVAAALAAGEVAPAAKQVQVLLSQPAPAAMDLVWAGQIASRQSDPALALDYGERALGDKHTKPYGILAAASLVLSVANPDSQPYASAWKQIEDVARDPGNPASLDALAVLANEKALPPRTRMSNNVALSGPSAISTPSPAPAAISSSTATAGESNGSSTQGFMQSTLGPIAATGLTDTLALDLGNPTPSEPHRRTMSLTEVADALEHHPNAGPYQKLMALEVRVRQDPILVDQFVADAIQRFRNGDDETLAALAAWLNKIGRPAKTLEVLPEARAIQRPDLFLQYVNALAALQRWQEVKDLLMSEHSVVDPLLQHMCLAVAQAHLGRETGAANEWQRALQVANTPEKLLLVATNAEQNSVNDIAIEAYSETIKIAPTNRAAYIGRLRLALAEGQTAQAEKVAREIARLWPNDSEARNQDAYLRLLLGASGHAAEAAASEAKLLVAKEPRNWQARATLGLACLRLGRTEDALAAIREPRVTGSEPAGPLAVRVAILAATGYEEGARNDALLVSARPLLPEERALIAPLLIEQKK